mmetsp:Transcript_4953/g.11427  ORF Transcript_4953/g.11427 Transcript_4953/m.11427 type:complete len:335 (-) Transcript_4953:144-1148(-)
MVRLHHLVQRQCVLEAGVHSLAEEGHHRVRRVAHEQHLVTQVPRVHAHGDQAAGALREELLVELGDDGHGVGELLLEEVLHRLVGLERVHGGEGREQRRRERLVRVRQRDEHELVPRPDVQRVGRLQRVLARRRRRDRQLLVAVLDVVPREVGARDAQHRGAHPAVGAVTAEDDASAHGQARAVGVHHCDLGVRIHGHELVLEVHLDALGLALVQQQRVDQPPRDGVDVLPRLAIRLERQFAVVRVHRAAIHRDGVRHDALQQAHLLERSLSARRERQIDAALRRAQRRAPEVRRLPRLLRLLPLKLLAQVGPLLVHGHGETALRHQQRRHGSR